MAGWAWPRICGFYPILGGVTRAVVAVALVRKRSLLLPGRDDVRGAKVGLWCGEEKSRLLERIGIEIARC